MFRLRHCRRLNHGHRPPLSPGAQAAGEGGGGEGESAAGLLQPRLQQGQEGGAAGQVVSQDTNCGVLQPWPTCPVQLGVLILGSNDRK